jgi:uncharacterized RDD family membrane protein YckC
MKCPKCHYIGFETADRCKNCGYEFSLSAGRPQPSPELPITPAGDDGGPLRDLALKPDAERTRKSAPLDLDRVLGAPEPAADLPLFAADGTGEELPPLVAPPVAPRRPLAVRRPTPDPSRMRPRPRDEARERLSTPTLPLPPDPLPLPATTAETPLSRPRAAVPAVAGEEAPPLLRVAAALVDVIILGAIDALTFYFTLRLCGLSLGEWRVLPILPLAAFFLLLDGGYLTLFTAAGGQTIGKMAFRLKVVGYEDAPVPVGLSLLRALGCVASTVCLGLGLLPAFFGGRLALHDRLADTRVVRASA